MNDSSSSPGRNGGMLICLKSYRDFTILLTSCISNSRSQRRYSWTLNRDIASWFALREKQRCIYANDTPDGQSRFMLDGDGASLEVVVSKTTIGRRSLARSLHCQYFHSWYRPWPAENLAGRHPSALYNKHVQLRYTLTGQPDGLRHAVRIGSIRAFLDMCPSMS